ncbi:hypothetical protein [Streptomyces sp. NPDC005322]|uniref:hypothetical protein n=1 Tax=Streptomyces sp. NPDC005322 TaxID=3157032 RepID=UPI0033AEABEB
MKLPGVLRNMADGPGNCTVCLPRDCRQALRAAADAALPPGRSPAPDTPCGARRLVRLRRALRALVRDVGFSAPKAP